MLISDKLKTFDFTDSEKEIVKYFLNQKEEIENKSTREISKKLYCSPSSIIRLCQKLGFTGFEEFKKMYIEELHYLDSNFSSINPSIPFLTEDNIQTISNKMCSLYHEIIDDTHSLLNHDVLRKSLNLLKNNKNIYIISSSSQNDLASTFRDKMARIGKHVNIYQHIDEPYYEACYLNKGDACFLLISYTGETQNCIRMARKLNERNIDFITITSFGTNTLSSLSHCILHVSTREKIRNNLGTFSMNLSTLYLLDLLYSMYFSLNYEENKKKKIEISDEYETFVLSLIRDTTNDLIK
ncbi:MurR/RpiR family transcriptional regulator [Faecalibacillus intestinalis]|uniref:MurR/RpiR family transcriptional regulator n=1 Tax=Faecalibacillus intestinalis TaxID=1982626 RepID=UPI0022E46E37|nr:MurR/RpiR family transcriptional regulator [Faecalibacillus intestinalis]